MKTVAQKWFVLAPSLFWLSVFFLFPLTIIFVYSFCQRSMYGSLEFAFTLQNYVNVADSLYLKPLWRSVYLAALNTIACLLIGYPLAYFISNQPPSRKNVFLFLVILPFWTNFLVRTYAWMTILRSEGILNTLLLSLGLIEQPLDILFTDKAIMIGLVYSYLPFMVLPLYASIEKLDRALVDVSKDLGATDFKTFMTITLPLTRPGIISGSILVFVPSFGEFVIPDVLGGAKNMMIGNLIKNQFLMVRNWPFGSALSFIVMAVVLLLLMIYIRFGLTEER